MCRGWKAWSKTKETRGQIHIVANRSECGKVRNSETGTNCARRRFADQRTVVLRFEHIWSDFGSNQGLPWRSSLDGTIANQRSHAYRWMFGVSSIVVSTSVCLLHSSWCWWIYSRVCAFYIISFISTWISFTCMFDNPLLFPKMQRTLRRRSSLGWLCNDCIVGTTA